MLLSAYLLILQVIVLLSILLVLQVEKKLSQMILDQKLTGSLHQDDGILIVYEKQKSDETFEAALSTIHAMGEVVDALYQRATKLN